MTSSTTRTGPGTRVSRSRPTRRASGRSTGSMNCPRSACATSSSARSRRTLPRARREQQIGDYYTAFMDEAAIEANGLTPAEPDLQRIAAAKSRADIARLFGSIGYATLFDVQLTRRHQESGPLRGGHQRVVARTARSRLLPQGRCDAEGAAREVRGLHRADADARRQRRPARRRRARSWPSRPRSPRCNGRSRSAATWMRSTTRAPRRS